MHIHVHVLTSNFSGTRFSNMAESQITVRSTLAATARILADALAKFTPPLQTYVRIAGLTAAAIQVVVLVAIFIFRVPQEVFTSNTFRLCALALLICTAVLSRPKQ